MIIKKNRIMGCVFALIATQATCASWHPYSVMGLGVSHTNQTQDLTLQTSPSPGLTNQYDSVNTSFSTRLVGFGLSKAAATLKKEAQVSLGVEALYLSNDEVSGTVRPLINVGPDFDRLNFSYQFKSLLFLAKATLSKKNLIQKWGGYVDVGVGGSFNDASSYHESILTGSTAIPTASPFANNNKAQFAFSVGAGVTHQVASRSEISIGYKYINTGANDLGLSANQSTQQHLSFKNLGHHLLTLSARL